MELVTATDLVVSASLALLLSFLVAKLVSFAITTDPKTTRINQLNRLCHVSVENKVHFQVPTNLETDHNTNVGEIEEINVESKAFELSVTPDIAVVEDSNVREEFDSEAVVVGSDDSVAEQRKTDSDCVNRLFNVSAENKVPFQLPTNIETDHSTNEEEKEETTVESNALELSVTPDISVVEVSDVTEEFDSKVVVGSAGSNVEQRKTDCDCVEETGVEKPSYVEEEEEERDVVLDGDDWEGVERSELEKVFMAATEFVVGSESEWFGSDVEKELYGLHKIATEGPCRQSQPMPLMFSARAKWNAWQKLGNMNPEVAMEKYISLVSDKVPGWMKDTSAGMSEHEPTGSEIPETLGADLNTSLSHQQMMLTDRELEQERESSAQDHSPLTESDLENNVKK
ncbi:PREDICTED: acyl-CoA-binding domain-containing protein 3-like isoform X1 [Lupinus angustifolius]|uniref:acyl-CoA-binding domain-containing protein 3-like isoform X1 n=1 Tax=Lupinus angustifolius TaxID=3871 RepID=UPI00092FB346|nr:PREDICTED: acyl-CoA-binding domain-containing protein 3-like isoform X1 [Lupinus angustifolius]